MNGVMQMAAIGGANGWRPSVFASTANHPFALGRPSPSLGATAQQSYEKAKPEIAQFDALIMRTAKIANKAARESLIAQFGLAEPGNKDKALYMRNALAGNVAEVESFKPPAYEQGFPAMGPSRGRVDKLDAFNSEFKRAVEYAEVNFGVLPEPVVIERLTTAAGETPGWVPFLVVGALAVGIFAAVSYIGRP